MIAKIRANSDRRTADANRRLSPNRRSRTSLARHKARQLSRPGWIEKIIRQSRSLAASLRDCSADDLQQHTNRLRRYHRTDLGFHDHRLLSLAGGAVIEAIRQTLHLDLFDTQLHAGVIVSCGAVAEMQTGEGKTLSVALPAYVHALAARGVHVATPNSYLAGRDYEKLMPVFSLLGMTTGLLKDNAKPEQTRAAYEADITYGPGHAFGFDYLRDQLTLAGSTSASRTPAAIGSDLYNRLQGNSPASRLLQRKLYASIVDEIDHVLIDDAVSPLVLSGTGNEEAADADVHRRARVVAQGLSQRIDYQIAGPTLQLTEAGFARVYMDDSVAMHPSLVRPWHEYVVLALRAIHCFQRDIHYVVRDHEIQIVDASPGRIFEDRTWSDGLHQAIETREGLKITAETMPLARITRQRFYRYYPVLGGMTGTANGCEREFASVYGLPVSMVPLRVPSKRRMLDQHVSLNRHQKLSAIADETAELHRSGRPVLIGTLNIAESIAVAGELESRGLKFELLNGMQDADEASIVAGAGQPGAITVATNLAGRGTDIGLGPSVKDLGGLHVIVTQHHALSRVDRQLIGRCARCGDPGTARIYISADDKLSQDQAPWIGRAIHRWYAQHRRGKLSLEDHLRRAQIGQQRQGAAMRWSLLRTDQENEKLLAKSIMPESCWQL